MGLRYQKRVGGYRGFGLNFSGSGISSSYRTKYGTIGSKGFSIRSGIPGLSFRSGYGRGKDKGATALIILGIILAGFALYYSAVILYNFALFIWWFLTETRKLILRKYYIWQEKKELQKAESLTEIENE
jgi:hypothetical protein